MSEVIKTIQKVAVLLVPDFSMMAFSATVEPLRIANRLNGEPLYEWRIYSHNNQPVSASNGLVINPTHSTYNEPWADLAMVCASTEGPGYDKNTTQHWLWQQAHNGAYLGGVNAGASILADAGLLDNCRCTMQWKKLGEFSRNHPNIDVVETLYEIDGNRFTSAGGTAALDLILAIVAKEQDQELAANIAQHFMHERGRFAGELERNTLHMLSTRQSPKLAAAVDLMIKNVNPPMRPQDIADQVGISLRQLERQFKRFKNSTPQKYYLRMRLEHAHRLLTQSKMPLLDIAASCGFTSQSHFTKCYREQFDTTPSRARKSASVAAKPTHTSMSTGFKTHVSLS